MSRSMPDKRAAQVDWVQRFWRESQPPNKLQVKWINRYLETDETAYLATIAGASLKHHVKMMPVISAIARSELARASEELRSRSIQNP